MGSNPTPSASSRSRGLLRAHFWGERVIVRTVTRETGGFSIGYHEIHTTSIDRIAPEALKLSVSEHALLAASLWESIEDAFELSIDFDDENALSLAEERDQEIESGRVMPLSHQELMQRLRQ